MNITQRIRLHESMATGLRELVKAYPPFCLAMLNKLDAKLAEGYGGWQDNEYFEQAWREQLDRHIRKIGTLDRHEAERENLVDLANLCMFAHWWIGQHAPGVTVEQVRPALRGQEPAKQEGKLEQEPDLGPK